MKTEPDTQPGAHANPSKKPERPKGWAPLVMKWLPLGFVAAFLLVQQCSAGGGPVDSSISYSDLYRLATQGQVDSVVLSGARLTGILVAPQQIDGRAVTSFSSQLPSPGEPELLSALREGGANITVRHDEPSLLAQAAWSILPWVALFFGWQWYSRRGSTMLSKSPLAGMLRSRTRRYEKEAQVEATFEDVAGLMGAKRDLREIVDFLREPARFRGLGGKVPRGVLLVGPPGTGKTLLARAVAGEAGVPFFSISGSEFIEMFVGVGASRVRSLFEEAKSVAPSIVFIDEIDAVGRSRGTGMGGGNDEREQTLNQLLSEMDGFTRNDLTIVMAATNRPDVLDSALLRPGRFDRQVMVDRPERAARREILGVHTRDKPLGEDVSLDTVAISTPGFSGADLANLANEAALAATRRAATQIEAEDFSGAYDRIVLGDVRETRLDPEEKHRVAVHESGHATLAHFTKHSGPLERVSIIPRGMALGVTRQSPGSDKHILTRDELESRLLVLMGGYAAEDIVLGACSSGAENDLEQATKLAFKMVSHFGMSDRIGPIHYQHRSEHMFLGQSIAAEGTTSDATVHLIEQEARELLVTALDGARAVVVRERALVDELAAALLDRETLGAVELEELFGTSSRSCQGEPKAERGPGPSGATQ